MSEQRAQKVQGEGARIWSLAIAWCRVSGFGFWISCTAFQGSGSGRQERNRKGLKRSWAKLWVRYRENMAHIRQSRPDSGLGDQVTVLNTFEVVPFCA